jgi:rubrerythrin
MSLLKIEPPHPVTSLDELFAIAYALKHQAASRYEELALRMRSAGQHALAETFQRLSLEENNQLATVVRWAEAAKGQAPDVAHLSWTLPETFDDEGAMTAAPETQTGYRALSMAVRNEERAFAFWSYIASQAKKPEIRQAAEAMAHDELEHVSTLRRERRRAYHSERMQAPPTTNGLGDTAALENRLATMLETLSRAGGEDDRGQVSRFAVEARRAAADLAASSLTIVALPQATSAIEDPTVLAEVLVERYLDAADRHQDESGLMLAQALASQAINRLAWLRAYQNRSDQLSGAS